MVNRIKLGDIATVITKGTTPTSVGFNFVDNGINFIKIESINEDRSFTPEKFAHISFECNETLRRSQLQENDILFSIAGAIGRTAIVTKDILPANTNQALAIIRIPKGRIDYSFLLYALQSDDIIKQTNKQKQGVAQVNLSLQNINDFEITIPSEEEQKSIVSVLMKVDTLIFERKQQFNKLDELVKSRFIEMFGEPMNNPKGYELVTYGKLFELNAGGTPSKKESKYWDGGRISWIGSNMCQNEVIYQNDGKYITEEGYNHSSAKLFPIDSVLIALVGATIGKTALLKFETATNQNVLGIRNIKESANNPYFVFYYTQGLYNKFLEIGDGGFSMASKNFVSKLPFPIVPLELQNQFSTFVEQTDKLKLEVKESLEKLETLKKSLMQKYFG